MALAAPGRGDSRLPAKLRTSKDPATTHAVNSDGRDPVPTSKTQRPKAVEARSVATPPGEVGSPSQSVASESLALALVRAL